MTAIQNQFECDLISSGVKPIITEAHETKFNEIDRWLKGAYSPGLLIAGSTGQGKSVLLGAIEKTLTSRTLRKELRNPRTKRVNSSDIIRIAHLYGREGLLHTDTALAKEGVLLIDDMGVPQEEVTMLSRESESIMPMVELLEYRCDNNLPTIITTELDIEGLREKYGNRISDRLTAFCFWIWWNFGASQR